MNRNLTLWIVSAVVVVLLPMGIVSLSTSSQPTEGSPETAAITVPPKSKQSAAKKTPTGIDAVGQTSSPVEEVIVAPTVVHLEPASEFAEATAPGRDSTPKTTSADKPPKEEGSEESLMPAIGAGVD